MISHLFSFILGAIAMGALVLAWNYREVRKERQRFRRTYGRLPISRKLHVEQILK